MFRTLAMACGLIGALALGACQSTTGKTAGQTMTDSRITAADQSKLTADRVSNFARVDVDTERGVVNLSGIVTSAEQKSRAEELTRQVNGVTRVNNNLQIQSHSSRSN